jgi:hypothetical protein
MNMHSAHKRTVDGGESSPLPAWSSSKRARMEASDSGAAASAALDGKEEAITAAATPVSAAVAKSTTAQSSSSAMDCPSAAEINSPQLLQQILQLLEAGGGSQDGPTTISATASSPLSIAASPPFGASHLQLAVAQLVPSVLTSPFQLTQARDLAANPPSPLRPSGAPAATPLLLAYALDTLVAFPSSSSAAIQRANHVGGGGGSTGSNSTAPLLSDPALERLGRCLGTAIQRGESTQGRQGMMQRHDLHQARNSLQRALARLLDSSQLTPSAQHSPHDRL